MDEIGFEEILGWTGRFSGFEGFLVVVVFAFCSYRAKTLEDACVQDTLLRVRMQDRGGSGGVTLFSLTASVGNSWARAFRIFFAEMVARSLTRSILYTGIRSAVPTSRKKGELH